MAYTEWGDADNPQVLICVHGLTRLGRDFDRLARAMASEYRVVCPDVVGRGRSETLRDPTHYIIPQYVADIVTLIARLNVEHVDWVGTSMGGLIGIGLAGQIDSPIRRFVINDVGPRLDAAAVSRIGDYVGLPMSFTDIDQAVDYISTIAAPFGLTRREDWWELIEPGLKRDGARWTLHYDPRIAVPFKASTPERTARRRSGPVVAVRQHRCPTLVIRAREFRSAVARDIERNGRARAKARTSEIPELATRRR